jgi:hypothetical protein
VRAAGAVLDAEVHHVEPEFAKGRSGRGPGKAGTHHDDVEVTLVGGVYELLMSLIVGPLFSYGTFGDFGIYLKFGELRRFDVGVILHNRSRVNHSLEFFYVGHI